MTSKRYITPKVFQRRLGALMKRCPEIETPRWKKWHREFEDFLFYDCSNDQAGKALDLYQLHAQNEEYAE